MWNHGGMELVEWDLFAPTLPWFYFSLQLNFVLNQPTYYYYIQGYETTYNVWQVWEVQIVDSSGSMIGSWTGTQV